MNNVAQYQIKKPCKDRCVNSISKCIYILVDNIELNVVTFYFGKIYLSTKVASSQEIEINS